MILDEAKKIEKDIISIRRKIHENPELSGKESETQNLIAKELESLGIPFEKVGNTSIIAKIKGKGDGKIIALRADIDALPIKEQSDVEFKSKNEGVMHACGHDAHSSMLLGAARLLNEKKDTFNGEIRLFFQEAEEVFGGAEKIIEAHGMDNVEAIFGMHGMPNFDVGHAGVVDGYALSGCDTIFVDFEGVSGHGSAPHLAKDTIHPACLFVTDLQSIITKNISPQEVAVATVGKFTGGTKANIISKYTSIEISMRYFNPKTREILHEGIKRHAKAIADMFEIKSTVRIEPSTPSTFNDKELVEFAKNTIKESMGEDALMPISSQMASEDFAKYLSYAKGCYIFMGYKNEEIGAIYPPHHEKFKIDEAYMKYGVTLFTSLALNYLK